MPERTLRVVNGGVVVAEYPLGAASEVKVHEGDENQNVVVEVASDQEHRMQTENEARGTGVSPMTIAEATARLRHGAALNQGKSGTTGTTVTYNETDFTNPEATANLSEDQVNALLDPPSPDTSGHAGTTPEEDLERAKSEAETEEQEARAESDLENQDTAHAAAEGRVGTTERTEETVEEDGDTKKKTTTKRKT